MVQKDFVIELNFARHPKFDANPFYATPNVDRISKDADKAEYRRLNDQYSEAENTLTQVAGAYNSHINEQDDYIFKNVEKPRNCYYQAGGNFGCR